MKVIPLILVGSAIAAGGTLFFTNPTEEDYAQYASQALTEEVQASLCEASGIPPLSERIDRAISGFCERTVGRFLSSEQVKEVLLENTERKNRFLFSTYETALPEQTYKAVGLFNRFYTYGSDWADANEDESGAEEP